MKNNTTAFFATKVPISSFSGSSSINSWLYVGQTRNKVMVRWYGWTEEEVCVGYPITFFGDGFAGTMTDVWHVGYYL